MCIYFYLSFTVLRIHHTYMHADHSCFSFLRLVCVVVTLNLTSQILNISASRTQDSPTLPPKIPIYVRVRAESGKTKHPLLSQLNTNWQCPTDFADVF